MKIDILVKNYYLVVVAVLIFIVYTLGTFAFYYEGTLKSDLNNHILASEFFGVPSALKERGVKPLYGQGSSGWDGQFYYYMANDLFVLKDTASHIDSPAYRYQRIGLAVFTALIAKLLGFEWVSPSTYFISYFSLLCAAVFFGALIFKNRNYNPMLILLWGLSVGTQLTLFNALPDAAADAFLILAVFALERKHFFISACLFTFSSLSREVYVIFPALILLFNLVDVMVKKTIETNGLCLRFKECLKFKSNYYFLISIIVFFTWHLFLLFRFEVQESPWGTLLNLPLVSWFKYIKLAYFSDMFISQSETISLVFFMIILLISFFIISFVLIKSYKTSSSEIKAFCISVIIISMLYLCFGPTVMMHYSGYLKPIALYFFLIPYIMVLGKVSEKYRYFIHIIMIFIICYTSFYHLQVRILPFNLYQYTKLNLINFSEITPCFDEFNAEITVKSLSIKRNLFNNFLVIKVLLKNTSRHPFISTNQPGSVFMSYRWVDSANGVIKDGIRSAIPGVLNPGNSILIDVVSPILRSKNQYFLKLSPVQEGCSWFYNKNPNVVPRAPIIKN